MAQNKDIYITLYRVNRDNQEEYMKRQWTVMYYALLLYAGIFSAFVKLPNTNYYGVFIAIVICVYFISSTMLCLLQESIRGTVSADKKFRDSEHFKAITKEMFGEPENSKSNIVYFLFLFANFMSCSFLFFLLFCYGHVEGLYGCSFLLVFILSRYCFAYAIIGERCLMKWLKCKKKNTVNIQSEKNNS